MVIFSHEDDKRATIVDGPWFIYDHYLTVKEWSPNFQTTSDTIEKVIEWIRIAGVSIEYYDAKFFTFIGNRVVRVVKVDKNTMQYERGSIQGCV